ncbi:MAG TPA: ribosome maturation factor RimM [Bryobacteraceae bacterium]|jgi:16S rRNA processing protein RimM|nr:ribosome maturation factor RimM [Bryobacteraceae bacterium]
MGNDWVTVAVLGRARGIRGELTAFALSKPERYASLREVFLFPEGSRREVESAWFHDNRLILKFRGVDSMSDAEELSGCEVRVPLGERIRLEPGEYFESDLIGCEVIERDGASLGRVTALQDGGSSGLLEVEGGLLIPFVRTICVAIEPEARRIVVELPAGLKELNQT